MWSKHDSLALDEESEGPSKPEQSVEGSSIVACIARLQSNKSTKSCESNENDAGGASLLCKR